MSLEKAIGVMKHAKGCWTCKRRKIGCDKTIPSCTNCLRTNRTCEGYGIKLAWPEDGDGRRPESSIYNSSDFQFFLPLTYRLRNNPIYFLNTGSEDLQDDPKRPVPTSTTNQRSRDRTLYNFSLSRNPSNGLKYGYETSLKYQESSLLSYYTDVLSRMITTIDDSKNGFRTVLLPVALSQTHSASAGLRQAVFALSAFHLWGHDAAVKYKLSALRLLSRSLQNGENAVLSQFATCMMLCVCDVFDSVDGSWHIHLAAAKSLANRLHNNPECDNSVFFLQTWLEYHDILAGFSSGAASSSNSTESSNAFLMPPNTIEDSIVVGALGCSRELMNLVALTTRLNSLPTLPDNLAPLPNSIQKRLENMSQLQLLMPDSLSGPLSTARITKTAELYRLGALIYLHSTILPLPRSSSQLQSHVQASLSLMEDIGICTSPWPVFVTAMEVSSDEDRVRTMRILDTMQRVRRIGNVDVLQGIVEAVWKQMDLKSECDGVEGRVDWRKLFDMGTRLPSFI